MLGRARGDAAEHRHDHDGRPGRRARRLVGRGDAAPARAAGAAGRDGGQDVRARPRVLPEPLELPQRPVPAQQQRARQQRRGELQLALVAGGPGGAQRRHLHARRGLRDALCGQVPQRLRQPRRRRRQARAGGLERLAGPGRQQRLLQLRHLEQRRGRAARRRPGHGLPAVGRPQQDAGLRRQVQGGPRAAAHGAEHAVVPRPAGGAAQVPGGLRRQGRAAHAGLPRGAQRQPLAAGDAGRRLRPQRVELLVGRQQRRLQRPRLPAPLADAAVRRRHPRRDGGQDAGHRPAQQHVLHLHDGQRVPHGPVRPHLRQAPAVGGEAAAIARACARAHMCAQARTSVHECALDH